MLSMEQLQKTANQVVRRLREETLASGKTFMIRDAQLPEEQTYREYPDGSIKLEKLSDNRFVIIRQLTPSQAQVVRNQFLSKNS